MHENHPLVKHSLPVFLQNPIKNLYKYVKTLLTRPTKIYRIMYGIYKTVIATLLFFINL